MERVLSPEKFVGEPVARSAGDDTRRGVIVAYDAVLRYWDVRYHDGHTERLNERGLREHGPPRTRCAQEPSPSEQAITEYLSVRASPGAKDWYMAEDSGLTPYQQRQMAQLATCSDYAVCRGKRGAPEHQLCPCGRPAQAREHQARRARVPAVRGIARASEQGYAGAHRTGAGGARLRDDAAGGAAVGYR